MVLEIFGANLKMNPAIEGKDSLRSLMELFSGYEKHNLGCNKAKEVVVFLPSSFLGWTKYFILDEINKIRFGSQGVSEYVSGSHTGENPSPIWLRELKVIDVLVGHSETRKYYEDLGSGSEKINQLFNRQIKNALKHGLRVIYCVGENGSQKENSLTLSILETQIKEGLEGIMDERRDNLIIAYEPRWAIGTDKIPSMAEIEKAHRAIRSFAEKIGYQSPGGLKIIYGGNMNHENASDIMSVPGVNGGLIGRACLDPDEFSRIVNYKPA